MEQSRRCKDFQKSSNISSRKLRSRETKQIQKKVVTTKVTTLFQVPNIPTSFQKEIDGRKIDLYCWMCHTPGQDKICCICPRAYHASCIKAPSKFSEKGVCPECQLESVDGTSQPPLTLQVLTRVLKITLSRMKEKYIKKKNSSFFIQWPDIKQNDDFPRIIDYEILTDRLTVNQPYARTIEFFCDVKYVVHNCAIAYGRESEQVKVAKEILRDVKKELMDIEACMECYELKYTSSSGKFFIQLCKKPHDIIWAKIKGYPYWPAKCLKIIKSTAHVRFFGEHEECCLPISNCFFISRKSPGKSPNTQKYIAAMEELALYVENYEKLKGEFIYSNVQEEYVVETGKIEQSATAKPDFIFIEGHHSNEVDTSLLPHDMYTTKEKNNQKSAINQGNVSAQMEHTHGSEIQANMNNDMTNNIVYENPPVSEAQTSNADCQDDEVYCAKDSKHNYTLKYILKHHRANASKIINWLIEQSRYQQMEELKAENATIKEEFQRMKRIWEQKKDVNDTKEQYLERLENGRRSSQQLSIMFRRNQQQILNLEKKIGVDSSRGQWEDVASKICNEVCFKQDKIKNLFRDLGIEQNITFQDNDCIVDSSNESAVLNHGINTGPQLLAQASTSQRTNSCNADEQANTETSTSCKKRKI